MEQALAPSGHSAGNHRLAHQLLCLQWGDVNSRNLPSRFQRPAVKNRSAGRGGFLWRLPEKILCPCPSSWWLLASLTWGSVTDQKTCFHTRPRSGHCFVFCFCPVAWLSSPLLSSAARLFLRGCLSSWLHTAQGRLLSSSAPGSWGGLGVPRNKSSRSSRRKTLGGKGLRPRGAPGVGFPKSSDPVQDSVQTPMHTAVQPAAPLPLLGSYVGTWVVLHWGCLLDYSTPALLGKPKRVPPPGSGRSPYCT